MAITIPSLPRYTEVSITYRSSAVDQKPYLGGPIKRIARKGDRFVYKVSCQPMRVDQAGPLTAALNAGLTEKIVCVVRQQGLDLSAYSIGAVVGAANGRTLVHSGGGAAKKVGQFFSVLKNGINYLHQITAVAGQTLTFIPALRSALAGGETLDFGSPKIEGFIEGNEKTFSVGFATNVGIEWTIEEAN
jgi:hypothetical protein